jgi:hypothetical protein
MARALVWKEFREQWVVSLTLVLVPAAGVAALLTLFPASRNRDEMLTGVLWFSAWVYGLVCGSLLLAGETEEETQTFLDLLPWSRLRLWLAKVGIGFAFVATQTLALVVIDFALRPARFNNSHTTFEVSGLVYCGLLGYGWGLLYGSKAATVMGAIGLGALMQFLTAIAVYVLANVLLLVLFQESKPGVQAILSVVLAGLAAAVAVGRSALTYVESCDRRDAGTGAAARMRLSELFSAVGREARGFAVAMTILGIVGTAALTFLGVVAWPLVTLVIGVFCGVTAAQTSRLDAVSRPAREREVSELRRWLVTASVRFAVGVAAAILSTSVQLVPVLIRIVTGTPDQLQILRTSTVFSVGSILPVYPFTFFTIWLVYGFAVGSLVGRLFQRSLAGIVVAIPCAFLIGGFVAPTLFVGGTLNLLRWWAAPGVLLLTTGVLMLPGMNEPRHSRRSIRTTLLPVLLGCGLLAAALTSRAAEIPVNPRIIDEAYFARGQDLSGSAPVGSAVRR